MVLFCPQNGFNTRRIQQMKARNLLDKARKELSIGTDERTVGLIKESLKNIADCKKTLKRLEKEHKTLLDTDVEDLESDYFEY